MDKIEKKEHIEHIEQLVSFWQDKLNHDDSNLIDPTAKLLIQHTIQCLKEMEDMLSLGYRRINPNQSFPGIQRTKGGER